MPRFATNFAAEILNSITLSPVLNPLKSHLCEYLWNENQLMPLYDNSPHHLSEGQRSNDIVITFTI